MTIRLDLRKRLDPAQPGQAMLRKTILPARSYGCGDCGEWFAYATGDDGLMAHVCLMRGIEYHGRADA